MSCKPGKHEIEERWVTVLEFLNRTPEGLPTKNIAEYVGLDTLKAGNLLRQMEKKDLLRSEKSGGKRKWWVPQPYGSQYTLLGFEPSKPNLRLKISVRRARKPKGTDARSWWSAKRGKKEFEATVPLAKVFWDEADAYLKAFRGNPRDLKIKLSWGAGSVAEWKCGCRVTVKWLGSGETTVHECGLPVCLRLVGLSKFSQAVLDERDCLFVFIAPNGLKIGQTYTLVCGCKPCVANVKLRSGEICTVGVISKDMGALVCEKHKNGA